MRNIRTIAAVGIAAAAVLSLTACTPASKEDQAIEQLDKFIAATQGNGELNYCDDLKDGLRDRVTGPMRINEGTEPEVVTYPDREDRVDVSVMVSAEGKPDATYPSSLWVRFPEEGGPCIMGGIGFDS